MHFCDPDRERQAGRGHSGLRYLGNAAAVGCGALYRRKGGIVRTICFTQAQSYLPRKRVFFSETPPTRGFQWKTTVDARWSRPSRQAAEALSRCSVADPVRCPATSAHFGGGGTSGVTAKNFLSLSLCSAAIPVNFMPFPAFRSRFTTTPSALTFSPLTMSVSLTLVPTSSVNSISM